MYEVMLFAGCEPEADDPRALSLLLRVVGYVQRVQAEVKRESA